MRQVIIFFVFILINILNVHAVTKNIDAKAAAKAQLSKMKSEDFLKIQKPKFIPEEKKHLYQDAYNKIISNKKYEPRLQSQDTDMDSLPAKFRTPGEFEESQAVFISWPSYAFDADGNMVEPYTPGVGLKWFQDNSGNWDYEIVDIEGYVLDLEAESPLPPLWSQLADAIQQEVPVWIRVAAPDDTTALKEYMTSRGTPLTNYQFLTDEDGENAFWARDFGPFGAYYGDEDSLMFVNAEYYPGRPIDDYFPVKIAQQKGYRYYKSPLEIEGGNFMTDGHGMGFFGNVIYLNNSDNVGPANSQKKPMNANEVNNELSKIFSLDKRMLMVSLRCDGGTGHIDIYTKMANDQEILITKYPDQFNTQQFPDYGTANGNRELILAANNAYGKKFRFLEVPLPTDDDGKYNRTGCNSFGTDARGYINGLTVNKTFIVPTYSNDISGNKVGDDAALDIIRQHMPGYKVVPIDSRILTPLGGAIHCITMQIPAENPVTILHRQYKGELSKFDILEDGHLIPVTGKIRNHSGFSGGKLYYRCGSGGWFETNLVITSDEEGSNSDFNFSGMIDIDVISCGMEENISYYMDFKTNNGKTAYRPIAAPEGYYTFSLSESTSGIEDNFAGSTVRIYPNPANDIAYISIPETGEETTIEISDLIGSSLGSYLMTKGTAVAALDLSNFNSGMYLCKVRSAGKMEVVKLIVTK